MFDFAQEIQDYEEELEERFGCDEVSVNTWSGKVTYHLEWDEDPDATTAEQLEMLKDVVENKLDPTREPDNIDTDIYNNAPTINVVYVTDEDELPDDETDQETEEEDQEE